jgi:hypothetical protein
MELNRRAFHCWISDADRGKLAELASRWDTSKSGAIRRILRDADKQGLVKAMANKHTDKHTIDFRFCMTEDDYRRLDSLAYTLDVTKANAVRLMLRGD